MIRYITVVLFFVLPNTAWCLIDTLKVASTDNATERTVRLRLKVSPKEGSTFNISTKEDSLAITLTSKIVNKDTLFLMQDSSENALNRIYGLLGCQEADLKTKYFAADPRLGNVVVNHLVNQIFRLPNRQTSLVVSPMIATDTAETGNSFFTKNTLWGIIGFLILILGTLTYLYLMAKKSKAAPTSNDPLKDKINEIKSELDMNGNTSDLRVLETILNRYYESIKLGKDYEDLSRDLEETKQNHQRALQEIDSQSEQEKAYLTAVLNEYVKPFIVHFKDDTEYPANAETQRKLIENLLPLAFHFMSFVKHKNGVSNEQDVLNIQQFRSLQSSSLLKTIDFSANTSNTDNKLVLHVIDLLKKYDASELKNVNINGYLIKNDSSK